MAPSSSPPRSGTRGTLAEEQVSPSADLPDGSASGRETQDAAALDRAEPLGPGLDGAELAGGSSADGARAVGEARAGATATDRTESDPTASRPQGATQRSFAAPLDGIRWTRMLLIGLVCFSVWLLLDAPTLQRSAAESPLGVRRTVSLDVVGPIAALSRGLGLSHVVGWADEAMGRTPGGGPALAKRTGPPLAGIGAHKPRGSHPATPVGTPAAPALPALDPVPSAANPLRVLVIGDSIGIDLGQPLVADLSATGVATATLDGRIDPGLSRPDYFDWPAELGIDLANDRPQLVVVMMGANDPQSLTGAGGGLTYGAPGWNQAYEQRVGSMISEANGAGAHVLWVGMPPMAAPGLNAGMQAVNSLVQSAVAANPTGAAYLASTTVLGDPQGNFTAYLPDSSGSELNVRTPDGTHLSPDGGERLSQAVIADIRSQLHVALPG